MPKEQGRDVIKFSIMCLFFMFRYDVLEFFRPQNSNKAAKMSFDHEKLLF